MAMTKKLGTELATGVTSSGITNLHEQSATKNSAGELKSYKNEDGEDISVYVVDKHKEISFEAIFASTVTDKEVGDSITIGGHTYLITSWNVTESNEDVKKVSFSARDFPDISTSGSNT